MGRATDGTLHNMWGWARTRCDDFRLMQRQVLLIQALAGKRVTVDGFQGLVEGRLLAVAEIFKGRWRLLKFFSTRIAYLASVPETHNVGTKLRQRLQLIPGAMSPCHRNVSPKFLSRP
jgi:hypothetical protein